MGMKHRIHDNKNYTERSVTNLRHGAFEMMIFLID